MKVRIKVPSFDAVQWQPGTPLPRCAEVKTDNPTHPIQGVLTVGEGLSARLLPGNWVVTGDDGCVSVWSDSEFRRVYEAV